MLIQLVKALNGVRNQIEADFNMISQRYHKLFQSLNKSLETRIREIDRPAMKIAEIKKNVVFDKLTNDSSLLFSAANEIMTIAQTAISGKLKQKTSHAIDTLYHSNLETSSYNAKLEKILFNRETGLGDNSLLANNDKCYLPVVISSAESLINKNENIENSFIAQSEYWGNINPVISEVTRVQNNLNWSNVDMQEKEKVKNEFISLCEKDNMDERVSGEISRLFNASSWEAL
jgi:hypothetical protein